MLYHSNSIDKLQYAIFPNKYEIYFGEIPNALISNQSRVKCDIINNRWSCLLHKIYLSNNESLAYNCTNIEAIFQAQEVNIYVDHNFLSFFVQTVNNCIIEGREEERYVSCQITSFKKIKNEDKLVAELINNGKTNKEIADELGYSVSKVKRIKARINKN